MTIAFIADLHLTPERPASTRLFEAFLRGSARILERLYILGDLFDYWVGDDGGDALGHDSVEAAIRQTVAAGTQVFFMHGNRDFLVGAQFARRNRCTLLPDPTVVTLGQRDFLLTHGDALCTDDIEHQRARQQMLSSKWKMAFLDQPLAQRLHTAAEMRRSSEAGKRTKSMTLMDVNQAAVEALMRAHKVETIIHGHTHQPAVHHFQLNHGSLVQKPAWRYVLGDWYEQRSALYYHHGKLALRR